MRKSILTVAIICIACIWACKGKQTPSLHDKLNTIFEDDWKYQLKEFPLFATYNGVHDQDDKLPSVTEDDQKRWADHDKEMLKRLTEINRTKLTGEDRINFDTFRFMIEDRVAQFDYQTYLVPFEGDEGFHTAFIFLASDAPFDTPKNYENYIARLKAFKTYMGQNISLMREGLQKKRTFPQMIMDDAFLNPIDAQVVDDPEKSVFFNPLKNIPETFDAQVKDQLIQEASQAISQSIVPAFKEFARFLREEYIPGAAKAPGISEQPDGKALYAQRVHYFTTTDLTPDEIYNIGLKEVKRIHTEMDSIIKASGFKGSFAQFLHFLRNDPRFYATSAHQLLAEASYFAKKMDGKLPQYFNHLPRNTYGVAPVPDAIAPNYTGGRYIPGSLENHKAGTYWVNTYNLKSRPLYVLPALTLHEAVPGHHLQGSLAQELTNVPEFRKNLYFSAFGEGWALYCEYLGEEAGIYETPYQEFGRLTYEMWRACRLVVDVGIHVKGWTRQQAVDYLASNTALSLHEVHTEINRYIGWPGQALSYKIGELKIRDLRKKAEAALGDKFDLRAFHDVVLSEGAVPLFVLEDMVQKYIDSNQ